MSIRRVIQAISITAVGLPAIALLACYLIYFAPYLSELKKLSSHGLTSISSIEKNLYSLAVAAETKQGIRNWAIHQSYEVTIPRDRRERILFRHAKNIVWLTASYLHFNDRQIFGIWVECAIENCSGSLNQASQKYFGKNLRLLTPDELAEIVASVKSPKMFPPGSAASKVRAQEIIQNAKDT